MLNLAKELYVAVRLREHRPEGEESEFSDAVPLLAPGAIFRADFREVMDTGCPGSIDAQVLLYRRVNAEAPIGLDPGETVQPTPVAAQEIHNVPACCAGAVSTYTIVNWEPQDGLFRVKFAQDSPADDFIRSTGRFDNPDTAWEFTRVDPVLGVLPTPPHPDPVALSGRVVRVVDGVSVGVESVLVLLRTRFRVRLDDGNADNDPDDGHGDPIDFRTTDGNGVFSFERPAGAYLVEFASDSLDFRPQSVAIETPQSDIVSVAEEP